MQRKLHSDTEKTKRQEEDKILDVNCLRECENEIWDLLKQKAGLGKKEGHAGQEKWKMSCWGKKHRRGKAQSRSA